MPSSAAMRLLPSCAPPPSWDSNAAVLAEGSGRAVLTAYRSFAADPLSPPPPREPGVLKPAPAPAPAPAEEACSICGVVCVCKVVETVSEGGWWLWGQWLPDLLESRV